MPTIFAPHYIRATSPSGASVIIERGTKRTMGRALAVDAIRQGGIDTANLAADPVLKPLDEVVPTVKSEVALPVPDPEDTPNATAAELVGEPEPSPPTTESTLPNAFADAHHPGDSDVVTAILDILQENDPNMLKTDGMPKSFAITDKVGRPIEKEEREAAIEFVIARLGR